MGVFLMNFKLYSVKKKFFSITLCLSVYGLGLMQSSLCFAQSTPKSLDQRIEGFKEHNQELAEFDKARENQLKNHVKEKNEREVAQQKAYEEYLKQQAKQKKIDPETTANYEEYLLQKWQWKNNPEKNAAKENYIKNKEKLRPTPKSNKFDLKEYALDLSEENRVPFNKRKLFTTSSGAKAGGSSSGSGFSGGDYGGGGTNYIPPPSFDNDLPDFDDNNIPPPPPPPDFGPGGSDMPMGGEPAPFPSPPPLPFGGP